MNKQAIMILGIVLVASLVMIPVLGAPKRSQGTIGAPAYDSGWLVIVNAPPFSITLSHNLGTTEVMVYLIAKNANGPYQNYYSTNFWWSDLTTNEITLHVAADFPNSVRVMIWEIQAP